MNKQEFYNAFKKGVTCAITCLIIFFSAIFCFYAGYKLGRERVLDCETNIVNTSNVQTQSLQPCEVNNSFYNFVSGVFTIPVSCVSDDSTSGTLSTMYSNDFSFLSFSVSISNQSGVASYSISLIGLYFYTKSVNLVPIAPDYTPKIVDLPTADNRPQNVNTFWGYAGAHTIFAYLAEPNFGTTPITRVVVEHSSMFSEGVYGTAVSFYDGNSHCLLFHFPYSNDVFQKYFVPSRTIYVLENLADNDFYDAGYMNGYDAGNLAGQSTGYNNGYSVGDRVGYNRGYDAGINAGTQYSFSSLLTAVIDAPVHVFIDLLNFEIMGYNLLNLVVGLLTFAIIVLILKLVLGGK